MYVCMYINATREAPTSKKRKLTDVKVSRSRQITTPWKSAQTIFANITHPKILHVLIYHIISYRLLFNPTKFCCEKASNIIIITQLTCEKSKSLLTVQISITKNPSYS